MKHICMLISVSDIDAARKFYEELFGLEVFQNYGKNIAFTCGLALQQDFDWLVNLPKEKVLKKSNNAEIVFEEQDFDAFIEVGEDMKMVIKRFLDSGMTMEEVSVRMDVSIEDLTKLLNN